MATAIPFRDLPGFTYYGVIETNQETIWNGSALVSWSVADWATYAITMPDPDDIGRYILTIPASLPAGLYYWTAYSQASGDPSKADIASSATAAFEWDGTEIITTASVKVKTDNLPASPAATDTPMTLAAAEHTAIQTDVVSGVTAKFSQPIPVRSQDGVTTPTFNDGFQGAWSQPFAAQTDNSVAIPAQYLVYLPGGGVARTFTLTINPATSQPQART